MHTLQNVAHALPGLYDPALSVKIVEVAKKYDEPEVSRGVKVSRWSGFGLSGKVSCVGGRGRDSERGVDECLKRC
jgi:hypothetical protein